MVCNHPSPLFIYQLPSDSLGTMRVGSTEEEVVDVVEVEVELEDAVHTHFQPSHSPEAFPFA